MFALGKLLFHWPIALATRRHKLVIDCSMTRKYHCNFLHRSARVKNTASTATTTGYSTSIPSCSHPVTLGGRRGKYDPPTLRPPIHHRRSRCVPPHLPLGNFILCHTPACSAPRKEFLHYLAFHLYTTI